MQRIVHRGSKKAGITNWSLFQLFHFFHLFAGFRKWKFSCLVEVFVCNRCLNLGVGHIGIRYKRTKILVHEVFHVDRLFYRIIGLLINPERDGNRRKRTVIRRCSLCVISVKSKLCKKTGNIFALQPCLNLYGWFSVDGYAVLTIFKSEYISVVCTELSISE